MRSMRRVVATTTAMLMLPVAALPGGSGGAISGTVADPSGAPIPGVVVIAVNTATDVAYKAVTNARGFYALAALPIGNYEIDVRHTGFAPYKRTGLEVDLNSVLRVDVQLQLGAQKEALTVKASALHVETASAQIGEVISGGKMRALPLNGRSDTDLLTLQPGVAPASTLLPSSVVMTAVNTSIVPSGDLNPGNLSISGQREFANGFILNGSDVDERVNMGTAIIPNLDSIAGFRILTSNSDAEYGNYAGGEIIVATRGAGPIDCTATASSFCATRRWTRGTSSRPAGRGLIKTSSEDP